MILDPQRFVNCETLDGPCVSAVKCYTVGRRSSVGVATRYGAGRSGDRIPVGGEIFRIRPDRLRGPPNLLYNGYRVLPEGKAAGAWR
jgi:hypothetical protein